ncbi:hypothetical protein JAK51_20285 [Stenotrophomonas maltophilia]|uniref:lytic transglycosylase domain-containing protein n=1 Tax=Stenotrophomonas maltophilia TaxID=40324 RepID=UPI0021C78F1B|nr:lytic transglycosylase domain-containing protein [Stenotrophomonas maltophilia]MCU1128549.1 hypothetical protein [Stenotrophomonas maltophilia]
MRLRAAVPAGVRHESSLGRLTRWAPALLVFVGMLLAGCQLHEDPALHIDGGCSPAHSPFLQEDVTVSGQITFCAGQDDAWTGTIKTTSYPSGTRHVEVMLAGYPGTPGVTLNAVADEGAATAVIAVPQPREQWQRLLLDIPGDVARNPFHIELVDTSTNKFGWGGLGARHIKLSDALHHNALPLLAAVLLGNAWLIAVALCLPTHLPARARLTGAVLTAGCGWFLLFLAYVASTRAGAAASLLLLIGPFLLAPLLNWRRQSLLPVLMAMQKGLLPVLLLSAFVLWVGLFPFQWQGQPYGDPASRWPHLSTDAWLPMLFGDMLMRGHLDVPMVGDWLSSDRPPLQVGLYLLVSQVLPDSRQLVYQGISTWAQALVLLPVSGLLSRYMGRRARTLALFTLCLSAMMLLNTLYVWPKLLAAAFCLIYYRIMFPADGAPRQWALAGVAAALALLAHGGALFFLIGASVVNLAWYRRDSLRTLLQSAPVALALYLPWVGYQKFIDPPGDRLLKWHFAGKVPVSDESVMHAITSAYSQLTPATWLAGRLDNLAVIVKGALTGPADSVRIALGHAPLPLARFIDNDFFHTFHSLWFCSPLLLLPCLVVWWVRSRGHPQLRPAFMGLLQMTAATLLYILVWATVLFEPGTATINTGAYAGVVLLQLAVLVAARGTSALLFNAMCVANIIVALAAYILDRHFLPGLQALYVAGIVILGATLLAACWGAARFDSARPAHHPSS